MFDKNMNIILLTGGISAEREVSLASSRSLLKALRERNHNVTVIDPVYGSDQPTEEEIFQKQISTNYPEPEILKQIVQTTNRKIFECVNSKLFDNVDIVFIGLHGKFGEDGVIQSLLEMRGVKYTGSGFVASALCLDKHYSKILFRYNKILTPDWITFDKSILDEPETAFTKSENEIGYPFVIKPNDEGSTVGLTLVKEKISTEDFLNAINTALSYSEKVMIEKFISGRELTCTIVGSETFPIIEIKPKSGFYDYEHKYTKGMTEYICPAEIDEQVAREINKVSMIAHTTMGCRVYSRIDFILTDDGNPYCLEINTLPGMTETSLVPKSARAKGIEFPELLETIINLSLEK
ncbi:D-alanine--D-alanine ligase [Ignavibacteria bacterium CHB1]|nr:MAG: D-alanine--D-alanine ligase [Chlorobiota bacterium]MBV6397853.1 D-alanine--D-alanine ligase B [Ignavibacteria bacterium]MCC6886893.1 D-alanine--D-alanine ligase [Ignavibacteriales bacterium]MCE7953981.1 D-alanine--D-alanine ligase [Chlorobi bacterium CHB7]MDL1887881.1 D-alanine--D-alanine ligase [Ignavibacteria bacterium CHB1]RIK47652.1 MAG: D-alanine--D-alanine ligase [Ignavibacteriota bacterium]